METVKVKWVVNIPEGFEKIEFDELECDTLEEWESLGIEDQRERLQVAINERPSNVCAVVEW